VRPWVVANVGGREFADSLAGDVQKILTNPSVRPIVRKKAALCLLRLFRKNKEILVADTWAQKMLNLLDERDLGILTGVISLLTGIVAHDSRGYEACIPKVCAVMQRLARNKDIPQAGPHTYCSPRHGTAFNSRHQSSKCVG